MALRQPERQRLRRESTAMAGETFGAMLDDDRDERDWAMPRPHYRAVGRNRLALVG